MTVVWDMETHDPDDFLTLLLLLGHPSVRLKAVTLTPGTPAQVGLVRRALGWFGADLPVGASGLDHPKDCVSSWHARAYGPITPSRDAEPAAELLRRCCDEGTTLLTGGPPKNLGAALKLPGFRLGRWVAQGGFAGEGVVPREQQLEKFRGRVTCPTFNLNGDPRGALAALASPAIGERRFVSKNVCHGVVYDEAMHEAMAGVKRGARSLELIWQGMDVFLDRKASRLPDEPAVDEAIGATEVELIGAAGERLGVRSRDEAIARARAEGLALVCVNADATPPVCRCLPAPAPVSRASVGKMFHDPLAACCAIDEGVGQWAEVELFRERGEWGSRLCPGSRTWIITGHDQARFWRVLTERAPDAA